MSKPQMLCW